MATINQKTFMGGFRKLWEQHWGVDVCLRVGDSADEIFVHKLILVARSDIFKTFLESDGLKDENKSVETLTLSDLTHEQLQALVEFMYSDNGSITSVSLKKHALALYTAADKYEIPHLGDICRKHIISTLNISNAVDILKFAQIPFDESLHDAAFTKIVENVGA